MGGRLPAPVIWVTHDRRYNTWDAHLNRREAERERKREPSMIDVVAYAPQAFPEEAKR